MAATDTILRTLSPGDHVVCGNDVYGGTFRLFDKEYRRFGLEFTYVDSSDPQKVADALQDNTRLVWVETPSNPLLNITPLAAVAEIVKNHQSQPRFVVDNTFATPYLQQPLVHGADAVIHSMTKYMGGHSDSVGGAIATNDSEFRDRLAFLQNAAGAVPGPMECFLVLRGLKTLAVRMDRHAQSAGVIVDFLKSHTNVEGVIYPFDETHPGAQAARSQMKLGGGMISFIIKGGPGAAREMVAETKVFTLAESLGGVESLIEVPAAMTHLSVSESPLAVSPALVRLSVGLENIDDLLADLEQALR
jgi:cystathionine beta-lyase/cystathionine gamma-synthase